MPSIRMSQLEAGVGADVPLVPPRPSGASDALPRRLAGLAALASVGAVVAFVASRPESAPTRSFGEVNAPVASVGEAAAVDEAIGLDARPPECMGLELKADVDGRVKTVHIPDGYEGSRTQESCVFDDGYRYEKGEVVFECRNKEWHHLASSCTNSDCLPGDVTIDFYGGIGPVDYYLNADKDNKASVLCPADAPNPEGHINFECGKNSQEWKYISQDCQVCDPTSLIIHFEGHTKMAELPSGGSNFIAHNTCDFEDGHSYKRGSIIYKCFAEGWKFFHNTCRDGVCPTTKANVRISYVKDGELTEGNDHVEIPGGNVGYHEVKCPKNAPKPDGKIVFYCQEDGDWVASHGDCGGGTMVSPRNFGDMVGIDKEAEEKSKKAAAEAEKKRKEEEEKKEAAAKAAAEKAKKDAEDAKKAEDKKKAEEEAKKKAEEEAKKKAEEEAKKKAEEEAKKKKEEEEEEEGEEED